MDHWYLFLSELKLVVYGMEKKPNSTKKFTSQNAEHVHQNIYREFMLSS